MECERCGIDHGGCSSICLPCKAVQLADELADELTRLRAREAVCKEALNQAYATFRNADLAENYTIDDLANDFVKVRKIVVEVVATLDVPPEKS